MSANISPTPWEACGGVVRDAESISVCTCDWLVKDRAGANAAMIVRAVNCHEELLAAAVEARQQILEECVRAHDRYNERVLPPAECSRIGCAARRALDNLEAAIRKAKDGDPA